MCVICMYAFNTNAIISATRYQIEIKLPFRNDNVFVFKVLSISFQLQRTLALALRMQWCVPYVTR